MSAFDDKYWNLSQAAAWVEYRDKTLVERFRGSASSYSLIHHYPTMGPALPEKAGTLEDLRRTLIDSRLTARGYSARDPDTLASIPADRWQDLDLIPPYAYDARHRAQQHQPWTEIRVLRADVERLWRSSFEISGRTTFDWAAIRRIFEEVREQHPSMTKNELIGEIALAFEAKFNKPAPSRSSIQRHMKTWT